MFNRQIKEDIKFINVVLRKFERLIASNNKKIIELEERIEIYVEKEETTRCKCDNEIKETR